MSRRIPMKLNRIKVDKSLESNSNFLGSSSILISRQMEMLNLLLNYEQANKYNVKNHLGETIGYICEHEHSFKSAILRQLFRTRRAFDADILDKNGNVFLKINRPIRWFLNSKITIATPEGREIGHCHSNWHPWRRRYDLFLGNDQFAAIDGGFWTWDFLVTTPVGIISSINRNFVGLLKEVSLIHHLSIVMILILSRCLLMSGNTWSISQMKIKQNYH